MTGTSKFKPRVLFVGGFKEISGDGSYGGQVYACRTLINSSLSESVDFILLDTTSTSVNVPSVFLRFFKALIRLSKFVFILVFKRVDWILVFSSSGFSFIEKGLMVRMGKIFGKKTIFAPRSGLLMKQLQRSRCLRKFGQGVFNSSDRVICQGEFWRSFFLQIFPDHGSRLIVQFNWIDLSSYHFQLKPMSSTLRLLFIGQFHAYKGLQDLLVSVKALKEQPVQLTIYGGGNLKGEYEEYVYSNDLSERVCFKGWATHVQKIQAFSEADVLVIPSHTEGMPNVMLEAMASGVLVIATDVGGIPEIIRHKETGLLVNPSNPVELANAILWVLENRQEIPPMISAAYARINSQCAMDAVAKKFSDIFMGIEE